MCLVEGICLILFSLFAFNDNGHYRVVGFVCIGLGFLCIYVWWRDRVKKRRVMEDLEYRRRHPSNNGGSPGMPTSL